MSKKHILFIVENCPVPQDLRVWNEALAAREFGYDVSIISPANPYAKDSPSPLAGIRIFRHPRPSERSGKLSMVLEYVNALFWETLLALRIFLAHPFQLIHGANPPDHIFLIAALFRVAGVKYIFDHHDIVPENYFVKYGKKGLVHQLLGLMERATFKVADLVISTNESYKKIAVGRGRKKAEDVFVVRNAPRPDLAAGIVPNPVLREGFKHLVGYVGIIGQQEGIENLLQAASYIRREKGRTDIKFVIIGPGPHLQRMIELAKEMDLESFVQFTGFISRRDLDEILITSDLCVNPEFRNEFTDNSTMIKNMEYMMFGKPILQFYTREGEATAGEAAAYVRENDVRQFGDALLALLEDPKRLSEMGASGLRRMEEVGWPRQKEILRKAYQRIFRERP